MVSAEIGACRDSGRRRNFKGLRPNLEVESAAVEFGATGEWAEFVSYRGLGFRPELDVILELAGISAKLGG